MGHTLPCQGIHSLRKGGLWMVSEGHTLRLSERAELTVTGVTEVARFEEDGVLLMTQMGQLLIQGEQLQLKELSLEGGHVALSGTVNAMVYSQGKTGGGWFRRLLG